MGIRDIADRLKHSRIVKSESTEHEKKSHEEQERKYESKKKFHSAHNADRPKEVSTKEKVIKSVFLHGKKLAIKAREKAQEEATRQGKKSKKPKSKAKNQTKKSRLEPKDTAYSSNTFGFSFGNNQSNEQFNFGFGNSAIPLDEMFDFRNKRDHSKLFKKKET